MWLGSLKNHSVALICDRNGVSNCFTWAINAISNVGPLIGIDKCANDTRRNQCEKYS